MIEDFYKKNKINIQVVGSITAIGALFLNIQKPKIIELQKILLNIQMFWLILITLGLSSIFIDFIFYIISIESKLRRKKLPIYAPFSIAASIISFWFLINLWNYILLSYGDTFIQFSKMLYPALSITIGSLVLAFVVKKKLNIFIESIITILIVSMWFSNVVIGIEKYFSYQIKWIYAFLVFCLIIGISFLTIYLFVKIKNRN